MRKRIILGYFLILAACAASAQQKALYTAFDTMNAAKAGFVKWDLTHQEQILQSSPDQKTARAAIADYRLARVNVQVAFVVAYSALALAATEIKQPTIDAAVKAVVEAITQIEALKAGNP